jgi:hypothetical protein
MQEMPPTKDELVGCGIAVFDPGCVETPWHYDATRDLDASGALTAFSAVARWRREGELL